MKKYIIVALFIAIFSISATIYCANNFTTHSNESYVASTESFHKYVGVSEILH